MTHRCQNCARDLYCECPVYDPGGCVCYGRDTGEPLCDECAEIVAEREAAAMHSHADAHYSRLSILVDEPLTDLLPPGVRPLPASLCHPGGGPFPEEPSR